MVVTAREHDAVVVWHDLECGAYTADLPLWRELAASAAGAAGEASAVLDVGAGSGRVTLDLARRGFDVTALDLDERLLATLDERARELGVNGVETVCADARSFALERDGYALCIVPMQTLQLLAGAGGRRRFFERARAHVAHGGLLACAIVTDVEPFDAADGAPAPSPETARVGPLRYVSRATLLRVDEHVIRIERRRGIAAAEDASSRGAELAPAAVTEELNVIELDRVSVAQLHREGAEAGFEPAGTRAIAETEEHTASLAVLFRA